MARTPYSIGLLIRLWSLALGRQLDPVASLDYTLGFSKVNSRDRFKPDIREAQRLFDRLYRPSAMAEDSRATYLTELDRLLARARTAGMTIGVIKMPIPKSFLAKLPGVAEFDVALGRVLATRGIALIDDSILLDGAEYFYDSDHLGRRSVREYLRLRFLSLLRERE